MNLMNRTVAPRTFDSDTTPDSGASASDESNRSNASQVLALGPTLDACDAFASGQALTLMHLLNLKSWALGPTLDSLDSLDSFAAVDSEAPDGFFGGTWI